MISHNKLSPAYSVLGDTIPRWCTAVRSYRPRTAAVKKIIAENTLPEQNALFGRVQIRPELKNILL